VVARIRLVSGLVAKQARHRGKPGKPGGGGSLILPQTPKMTCPCSDSLQQFLGGSSTDRAAIEAHVSECPRCLTALDSLSDNSDLRRWVSRALALPAELVNDAVLARLVSDLGSASSEFLAEASSGDDEKRWPPGSLLGNYRIEREVGRGGMGVVLRAYDESLGRIVALKVLRSEGKDVRSRSRLVHEARVVARLRHDNVVTVHTVVNPPDGAPYLVMEYVEGPTVAAMIGSQGRLNPAESVAILAQVASGLEAAHVSGLIHRDIKPSNVLVDAVTGRAKITDFGLARLGSTASGLTHDGALAGTPTYMSPEQASGTSELDRRSDIYSLGVTLYEALTGEVPFRGTPHMVLRQVLDEEPRSPRLLNDKIPYDLETICLKAMAKEPGRRYQTAQELCDDLRRWKVGEPILARPVGKLERGWRWCRRNPRMAILGGTVLALFVIIAMGSSLAAALLSRERSQAERERLAAVEARERADRSARAAQEHFQLALSTLNTLITKVHQQLGDKTGTLHLRQQLTETALKDLERIAQSAQATPDIDRNLVIAHDRLGELFFLLGKTPEARREFARSRDLADSLIGAGNRDTLLRRDLAGALDKLGNLDKYAADHQGSAANYRRALSVREELVAEAPDNRLFRRDLAVSHNKLGEISLAEHDALAALAFYQQGLAETQAAGVAGDQAKFQDDLGFSYKRLGDASLSLWDLRGALGYYRQSLKAHEAWTDPGNPRWQLQISTIFERLGRVNLRLGDYDAAVAWYQKCFAGYEAQAKAEPANFEAQRNYAVGYSLLAQARRCAGDYNGTRAMFEMELSILEDLARRDPGSRQRHLDVLELFGDLAENDERAGRYADAAHWLERGMPIFEHLAKPGKRLSPALEHWKKVCLRNAAVDAIAARGLEDTTKLLAQTADLVPDLLRLRGLSLARRHLYREASDTAEQLKKTEPAEALNHMAIARIYALCAQGPDPAQKQRYLDLAADAFQEALRRSRALGQGQPLEPDLVALREHPKFRAAISQANSSASRQG
jgi:tetratricopeptide (TPR) repeat protein